MRIDFGGRTVVVTGGTGALGRAVVRALLESGGRCVIPVYREVEVEGVSWRDEDRVRLIPGIDLCDDKAVAALFEEAARNGLWGSVHVCGGFAMAPIQQTASDAFRRMFELNALTAFACTREASLRMSDGGRVVNVAARPALFPELGGGMVAYAASKAAVAALTQAAAAELVGARVLVNAVAPDVMDTPTNREAMPDADFSAWARVEDVASTIAFLVSPQNSCTRGGLVPVYGRG
ncbi:MAG: SDR family NAD(P)-dependent oxidoreductase [Planctomycetota bacterium]